MRRRAEVGRLLRAALLLGAVLLPRSSARAQSAEGEGFGRVPPAVIERADSLLRAERVEDALLVLEQRLREQPDDFDARWRAARAALYLGVLASGTDVENRWFRQAVDHAERALAARPDDREALRWALAAKGNLAVQTGVAESARLGGDASTLARRLLQIDPDSPEGHYALGKLEYEILKLSRLQRLLSRPFRKGELAQGSWPVALAHAEQAVRIDPGGTLYRLGLADILWRLGREAEAAAQLRTAADLPVRDAADRDYQARAELLLRRIAQGRDPTR